MRSFQIQDQNAFMTKLLMENTFDSFQLSEASITTYATFQVDGAFHPEYFGEDQKSSPEEERSGCTLWQRIRPFFYYLTRGKHTPLRFRIILKLAPHNVGRLLAADSISMPAEQIGGLFLNILFDDRILSCTSGLSLKTFSADRTLEHTWDDTVEQFFRQNGILYLVC